MIRELRSYMQLTVVIALIAFSILLVPSLVAQDLNAEFVGTVDAVGMGTITVNGQVVNVANAEMDTGIGVGDVVKIEGVLTANGIVATEVKVADENEWNKVELEGTVTSIDANTIVVNGIAFSLADAEFDGAIDMGAVVKVEGYTTEAGAWVATEVKLADGDRDQDDEPSDVSTDEPSDMASDDGSIRFDDGSVDYDQRFWFTGTIQQVGSGFIIIGGQQFALADTDLGLQLLPGLVVTVQVGQLNGQLYLIELRYWDSNDDGEGNNNTGNNNTGNNNSGNNNSGNNNTGNNNAGNNNSGNINTGNNNTDNGDQGSASRQQDQGSQPSQQQQDQGSGSRQDQPSQQQDQGSGSRQQDQGSKADQGS